MKLKAPASGCLVIGLAGVTFAVLIPETGLGGGRPEGGLGAPGETSQQAEEARTLSDQLVSLGVAKQELAELIQACRAAGFTEVETRRVLRLVVRAKLAGLPHTVLLNKLREGLAKGASPEAIEGAVERRAQLLRQAKSLTDTLLVEGWSAPDYGFCVEMVADALEAGAAPPAVLRSVREGTPPEPGVADVRMVFRKPSGER